MVKFGKKRRYNFDDDKFNILSVDNQAQTVKRVFVKEYQDLTMQDPDRFYFTIPHSEELGTDLRNCFVEVELEVVKENGQSLTEEDKFKIQPCNDFFDALFSDVIVLINGVEVGNVEAFHPQTAFLHNLINCDSQFQETVLAKSNIWLKDTMYPALLPSIRHSFIENSKRVKLFGHLNHNVFTTKRFLLPHMSVQIKMKRTDSSFCLIRSEGVQEKYKVVIHDCKLNVRRILFYDWVLDKLSKYSENHPAQFPYTQTAMTRFLIPKGSTFMRSVGVTQSVGRMPERAYFTICETESIYGNKWENNPMIYPASLYKVNHVQFYSEYDDPILQKAYKPDFANGNANRSYIGFAQAATDPFNTGHIPGLTSYDFLGQYGIFAIDRMPDCGDISIKVGFEEETQRNLFGLLFTQIDSFYTATGEGGVMNQ